MGKLVMLNMSWRRLIVNNKLFPSSVRVNNDHDRSEFERDQNKITFSPFFRQLQNKTQLFPIPHSDFIHSRLTHSLEVSSVGRSMGHLVAKQISLIDNDLPDNFDLDVTSIVGAACLLHDVGNPPFGHAGEDAISCFFKNNSSFLIPHLGEKLVTELSNFDGNAQALRFINNSHDLNLTISTIAALIKYPTRFDKSNIYHGKHSIFSSEEGLLNKIVSTCGLNLYDDKTYCRHPLVFLVEAADDICYRLLDLEDAHKLRLINYNEIEPLFLKIIESKNKDLSFIKENINDLVVEDKFAKLRSYTINILIGEIVDLFILHYREIMSGEYQKLIVNGKLCSLIDMLLNEDSEISCALNSIEELVIKSAYSYKPVLEIELAGYEILNYLLKQFTFAIINNHILPSKKDARMLQLLPERFRSNDSLQKQVMLATDYIASQADKYALDLYRRLKGIDLPEITLLP